MSSVENVEQCEGTVIFWTMFEHSWERFSNSDSDKKFSTTAKPSLLYYKKGKKKRLKFYNTFTKWDVNTT